MNIQQQMMELLQTVVRDGKERGVQLAVYLDGELIVDAWAGVADPATGRLVDGETLFPVFSVTKGIAATLIHRLVEHGRLSYDTPIADVWPEFAAHGKGGILVRHALSHTAGLPFMPMGLSYRDVVDWDTMCALLAQEKPVTPPGQCMAYHAVTYGWLTGEVARRVDGRSVQQQLAEEICQPLGLTGLFIGIPAEVEPRVAILDEIFDPGVTPALDDSVPRDVPGWMLPLHAMMNRPDCRRACIPGASGIMNARSLARHFAALLPGGVAGVELLPPARVKEVTQEQRAPEMTPFFGTVVRQSLGYILGGAVTATATEIGSRVTAFGHGGYIGSMGFADPDYRLAVALCKNRRATNNAQTQIFRAVRDTLEIPQ